ncbi:hypothetical protein ABZP36_002042 [Zizania latifolia]
MAEIVGSAVVNETVNTIISGLIDTYERKSSAEEQMERLEMAHIKLETALEASNRWQITGVPFLRWRKKLKHAAEECEDTLRKCRQRVQDDEEAKQPSRSAVRRFEWFADGANDFLRSVEFGGTPYRYLFFDPLIGRLLSGETLEYRLLQGNKHHLFWIRPCNIAKRGVEVKLIFVHKDGSKPEDNFFLGMMLQLTESTNIVGTTIKCLQLFTPHFKSATETIRRQLTQLPTQDFSWVSHYCSYHWDSIHGKTTEWFRPNPLCCKQHGQKVCGSSNKEKVNLQDVSLEPVIELYLECQFTQSRYSKQMAAVQGKNSRQRAAIQGKRCSPRRPYLKLGVLFLPHGSSADFLPADESFAVEVFNGEEQPCCHTNITLEQLDKIMLPKAIDSFNRNAEATTHQLLWKSKHEAVFFHVGKTRMNMPSTPSTDRKSTLSQRQDLHPQSPADVISGFLNLWAKRAPVHMQRSIVDWVQKQKEMQLEP